MRDRQGFIGGSDVAAILGVSPWKSPFLLYQEKIGEYREDITPEKQRVFDRGHRWEPVVVDMLADELRGRGHHVDIVDRNARYTDPEHSFLAAEIDLELRIDGVEVNGEIKTVHPFAARDWGEEHTDEIPIYYAAQVQHGLMVRPRPRTVVAALIGVDDLRIHIVERDADLIAAIREREVEFWQRIQDRNPPPPSTDADVRWLYRTDSGAAIEADAETVDLFSDLIELRARAKRDENEIALLTRAIKLRMGDAATLLRRGQVLATWKNNKPSVVVDWRSAYYDLHPPADHADGFTTTKPGARPFLLKI